MVSEPQNEMFNLEDVGFQLQKLGTIHMHMFKNMGTNGRDHTYNECHIKKNMSMGHTTNTCLSCIYMQG